MLFHISGFLTDAQPLYLLYSNCSNTGNYTAKSIYESNRNSLLDSFPSNDPDVQLTGFYNATVGMPPDRVYGLVVCRGDVNADDCRNCVTEAREEIRQSCQYKKAAVLWYEYCVLRYSDANIFSNVTARSNWVYMYNTQNVTEPLPFKQALGDLLDRLILQEANGPNSYMLATGDTDFRSSSSQKLYGLVQCRRVVAGKDCKECLDIAVSRLQACCSGNAGGRILGANCLLMYDDYPFYKTSSPPDGSNKGDSKKRKWLVPTIIIIILMVFLMVGTFICICHKRGNKHETLRDEDGNNDADIPFYDFASIMVATDRFSDSNKLGQGGFGVVYKGKLSQGEEIAVKRLSKSSGQGAEEFKNEVILIAKLQHRNLVRLLGYCISGDEKMLLYEYMPNRSLNFFLFDKTRCEFLDWTRRFIIILGIARGLLYLHQDSRLRIIHRDLKTSNILLDEEMNPKISDFGLARIFEGNQTEESTNRVVGTYGYMSPEYASHGLFSVKSDVFSFGVILIEIITGRKNTSFFHSDGYLTLLGHAWQLWKAGKGLELMDPSITETCDKEEILKCLQVGLLCVEEDAADRPTMATVITLLTSETAMLPTPRKPALFVRSHSKKYSSQSSAKNCSNYDVTMSCLEGR